MIRFEDDSDIAPISADTMTPMIDVILSLIAFMMLMINAPLLTMDVDLPDIKNHQSGLSSDGHVVNLQILAQEQQWLLNGELITGDLLLEASLKQQVIEAAVPVSTILTIDQNSPAQRMIDTLNILNQLGIEDTQIALEKQDGGA